MLTALERLVQNASASRVFMRIAPHFVPALDIAVHRLTGGRTLLSTRMLPSVVLTATGAKSGLPRRTPLVCMPEGGVGGAGGAERSWILVGSNFGRPAHPGWTANLLAHPDAHISRQGRDIPVRARLLGGVEREAAWRAVIVFWPPYARYQARLERKIRLFRLSVR